MRNKKSFYLLAFALTSLTLTSCVSVEVKPGAEKIRVFEAEPKGCLYMGEVSSVQKNEEAVPTYKEVEMSLDTRIDLRNKAFDLNGNVIVFMNKIKARVAKANTIVPDVAAKPKDPNEKPKDPKAEPRNETVQKLEMAKEEKQKETDKSVFLATVFRCPPLIFNQ